jgi:hypothetical protein
MLIAAYPIEQLFDMSTARWLFAVNIVDPWILGYSDINDKQLPS